MALTRAYEEHEVSAEIKRAYAEARIAFDLPFVPTLFKVSAGLPEYLRVMWRDLEPVAASKEFRAASEALEEYLRSLAIRGGWRLRGQEEALAALKFSVSDTETMALVVTTFARALPRMALFARLMQRGYSGGQRGRVSGSRQASAQSRLMTLHIPNERDAALRCWLIYSDIKRTTGAKNVLSAFRVLSPYPSYLASVWLETKRLLSDSAFQRARDEAGKRVLGLLNGLPVRDHRALARGLAPADWREIEETVDGFARLLPQFALST